MKRIVPVLFALVLAFSFAACKEQKTIVKGGTASLDEILAYTKEKAQEDSTNVNGKRYNINIEKFTERYNEIMFRSGGDEYLSMENWKRLGETKKDANGVEYFCYYYDIDNAEQLMENVKKEIDTDWDIDFSGSFFSNRQMLNELVVILFISILLMYFILAAQFESFLQPLIVLLEIPIDVAFALLLLWICGHTLNLMSAIGLIVTCGIIINDSILKLDAINELRRAGMPLLEAIHEAGRRRLRPIIMTSLTTIFAMVPLLFSFDMGSELQKPLSIAMIGAMFVGTLVSLFIIPLIYWFIYRKERA